MNFIERPYSLRTLAAWVGSTVFATALFWACFGTCVAGCVDQPLPDVEPQARVVASWDPLPCGDPHRVVVELEDDDGAKVSHSVPCEVGGMSIDIRHWGVYRGRIYAWTLTAGDAAEMRSVLYVRLDVDAPVIFWPVDTPR